MLSGRCLQVGRAFVGAARGGRATSEEAWPEERPRPSAVGQPVGRPGDWAEGARRLEKGAARSPPGPPRRRQGEPSSRLGCAPRRGPPGRHGWPAKRGAPEAPAVACRAACRANSLAPPRGGGPGRARPAINRPAPQVYASKLSEGRRSPDDLGTTRRSATGLRVRASARRRCANARTSSGGLSAVRFGIRSARA
jgi:hypothetical protein